MATAGKYSMPSHPTRDEHFHIYKTMVEWSATAQPSGNLQPSQYSLTQTSIVNATTDLNVSPHTSVHAPASATSLSNTAEPQPHGPGHTTISPSSQPGLSSNLSFVNQNGTNAMPSPRPGRLGLSTMPIHPSETDPFASMAIIVVDTPDLPRLMREGFSWTLHKNLEHKSQHVSWFVPDYLRTQYGYTYCKRFRLESHPGTTVPGIDSIQGRELEWSAEVSLYGREDTPFDHLHLRSPCPRTIFHAEGYFEDKTLVFRYAAAMPGVYFNPFGLRESMAHWTWVSPAMPGGPASGRFAPSEVTAWLDEDRLNQLRLDEERQISQG